MADPYDLDRVRRNWARAEEPEPLPLAPKAVRVRAPVDVIAEATTLLAKVRALGLAAHPRHREALLPFLDRADALLAAQKEKPDEAARAELLTVLVDLEDLFEVFDTTRA